MLSFFCYSSTVNNPDGSKDNLIGVQTTDTTYKTFLCQERIGISTCGAGDIGGVPLTGYIEDFITKETDTESTVDSVSEGLLQYFSKFSPLPATVLLLQVTLNQN